MEASIKLVKHARASKVVNFNRGHFRASTGDLEISMHAPFPLRLDPLSASKYLTAILSSDPITAPFGLDIWSPHKKVLNADYYAKAIGITSFRRGPWKRDLLFAAKAICIPSGHLAIDPTIELRKALWGPF